LIIGDKGKRTVAEAWSGLALLPASDLARIKTRKIFKVSATKGMVRIMGLPHEQYISRSSIRRTNRDAFMESNAVIITTYNDDLHMREVAADFSEIRNNTPSGNGLPVMVLGLCTDDSDITPLSSKVKEASEINAPYHVVNLTKLRERDGIEVAKLQQIIDAFVKTVI